MIVIAWITPMSSRWPCRGGARRNPTATERARVSMWRRRVSGDGRRRKKLREKWVSLWKLVERVDIYREQLKFGNWERGDATVLQIGLSRYFVHVSWLSALIWCVSLINYTYKSRPVPWLINAARWDIITMSKVKIIIKVTTFQCSSIPRVFRIFLTDALIFIKPPEVYRQDYV